MDMAARLTNREGYAVNITPRDLVAGATDITSLPDIIIRLNEMMDDPRCSAADIGKVIGHDPALTARLLRLVNSSFYGFPAQIDSISRAITVIGTRDLRNLVLATAVAKMFKGVPNELISMDGFWRHSVSVALVTRSLAAARREREIERYFIAGLLHDIGSLVLYLKLPELCREILLRHQHNEVPLCIAEQDVLGFDHTAAGFELLRAWNLPEHLQIAVAFHHRPREATAFLDYAALVHIAEYVEEYLHLGFMGVTSPEPLDRRIWENAGLPEGAIEKAVENLDLQLEETLHFIFADD